MLPIPPLCRCIVQGLMRKPIASINEAPRPCLPAPLLLCPLLRPLCLLCSAGSDGQAHRQHQSVTFSLCCCACCCACCFVQGLMRKRIASVNEAPIAEGDRRIAVPDPAYNTWLADQVGRRVGSVLKARQGVRQAGALWVYASVY